MSEPFIGEIKMFGFNFPPRGWAVCNGQIMPINQNMALFSLLGTYYGGDGQTTFALPDLQGRTPVNWGNPVVGAPVSLGESAGDEAHTLIQSEMPAHTHAISGTAADATEPIPGGSIWGASGENPYKVATGNTTMNGVALGIAGGSQPHANMQPYLVLNFCVALDGIFPSRN